MVVVKLGMRDCRALRVSKALNSSRGRAWDAAEVSWSGPTARCACACAYLGVAQGLDGGVLDEVPP